MSRVQQPLLLERRHKIEGHSVPTITLLQRPAHFGQDERSKVLFPDDDQSIVFLSNLQRGIFGLVTGAVNSAVLRHDLDEAVINGIGLVF